MGHPKNWHKGAGKKNGHSFPLNIEAFYIDFSHRGRGGYGSGGLGQWVTFKMGLRGPEKKNGHNFAPNMACFTLGIPMIRSAGGSRGSEGGSGRGAFKNTSKGGIKKKWP